MCRAVGYPDPRTPCCMRWMRRLARNFGPAAIRLHPGRTGAASQWLTDAFTSGHMPATYTATGFRSRVARAGTTVVLATVLVASAAFAQQDNAAARIQELED